MAQTTENGFHFDAFIPPEMAQRAEDVGVKKASLNFWNTLMLGVLAGAFIALGAVFATTVTTDVNGNVPFGIAKLLGGLAFSLGLVLVVVAGAELFTGNNLIVMAWAGGKVSTRALLRNWGIVYVGNFLGSLATAGLMFLTKQYTFGNGAVGLNVLKIAETKTSLGFVQALALGIMCNALVCLAVWLTFSARSTTDKILSIILPISAFVAAGFEHSVANMYFIPIGLLVKTWGDPTFFQAIGTTAAAFTHLTWSNFLVGNLLPVTLGNIIGGAGLVGFVYWFIYLRPRPGVAAPTPQMAETRPAPLVSPRPISGGSR